MQTVRLNKRALAFLAGVSMFLFLCALAYLSSTSTDTQSRPIRDVRIRKTFKPPSNVKHTDEDLESAEQKRLAVQYEDENVERREFIKKMVVHAWNGYKTYAWGANELRPIAKTENVQAIFGGKDMPATIVDGADTLWIMGLKEQYKEARDYIEAHMDMSKATGTLSVFETTIRFLGGLLSLYALTKEPFYIEKARGVGEALLPAFNTPTGIPKSNIDMNTHIASNYGWANGGSSILSEYASLHLEFIYLSKITKQPIFAKKVKKIRDVLDKAEKVEGLYPNYLSPDTGKFTQPYHMSLGALGDSYYEYLIKSWIQTNKTDSQAKKMYWEASDAIQKQMLFQSKSGLTYIAELRNGLAEHKMGHLACFSVGMFALQAVNEKDHQKRKSVMMLAEELGKTCHESYIRSKTRIGPEMLYFNDNDDATSKAGENGYIQRPEVIEGFFYLWRLTGKPMYREWMWDFVQALEEHCRREVGYAGLKNVYKPEAGSDDVQQSFLIAETLKYAYLTFCDNSVISLDEWVFNTEAHPFPIMNPENNVA